MRRSVALVSLCAVFAFVTIANAQPPDVDADVPESGSLRDEEMNGIDALTAQFEAQIGKDLSPPSGLPPAAQKLKAQQAKYSQQQAKLGEDEQKAAAAQAVVQQEKAALSKAQAVLGTVRGGPAALPADKSVPPPVQSDTESAAPVTAVPASAEEGEAAEQCEATCADQTMRDTEACDGACLPADEECRKQCDVPLEKCRCECNHSKKWICQGTGCHCWALQGEHEGPIESRMLKAENEALAEGLTPAEAKQRALEAEEDAAGEVVDAIPSGHKAWKDAAL